MNIDKQAEVRNIKGTPWPHWVRTSSTDNSGIPAGSAESSDSCCLDRDRYGASKAEPAARLAFKLSSILITFCDKHHRGLLDGNITSPFSWIPSPV